MTFREVVYAYYRLRTALSFVSRLVWLPGGEAQRQLATQQKERFEQASVDIEFVIDAAGRDFDVLSESSTVGRLVAISTGNYRSLDENSVALFYASAPPDLTRVAGKRGVQSLRCGKSHNLND